MPVYNAEKFVAEAIESILAQTYRDFELIIVDDASTDGSWNIVRKYKKRYPGRVRAVRMRRNINCGGDACANRAFRLARGEYIARMDADDIAHPDRLAKQVVYMRRHTDVILLGTQAYVIDAQGHITGEKTEPTTHEDIRAHYFVYHPMIHPSVMIRRSLLPKKHWLYRIKYNANNDLLTFFELLNYGKFANLGQKLLYYRIHGHNDSLTNPREKFFNTIKIRLHAWRYFGYTPSVSGVLTNIAQLGAVLVLPGSVIKKLYMLWRGVARGGAPRLSLPQIALSRPV